MSPLMWTLLFIFFFLTFVMFNTNMYFIKFYNPSLLKNNVLLNMKHYSNWKW